MQGAYGQQPVVYVQQPMVMQQGIPQQQGYPQQQQQIIYAQHPQGMMQPQPQQVIYTQQPMVMHQQQPVIYSQQPVVYAQHPYPGTHPGQVLVAPQIKKKGWERIQDRDGIFVKQKVDLLEAMTGCEQGNTYYVYPLGKDGDKKGRKFYKAKEKSSCFAKQCMSGDCRPFKLNLKLDDDDEALDGEPFLLLDRPCKCTCLCFNRPELTVTCVQDGANSYLGKVKDIWTCCNVILEIYDKSNNLRYKIDGSCLQVGMHCKGPMDCCETIDFDIKTPSGEVVSTLQKRSPGCINAMVSDADNFAVHFPNNATKEDKALILSAVLLLDYRYFEEKGGFSQQR